LKFPSLQDAAVADVVPSEELRSFLLRLYSAWEAQDFEALRDMVSTSAHVLVIGRPASGLVAHTVAARNL
jgi:hypothetical protein